MTTERGEPKEIAYHTPVMLAESLEALRPRPGGVYVDATLGGGGYSAAILPLCLPGGTVIGIDRDEEALSEASERLHAFGDAFRPVHGNFSEMGSLLDSLSVDAVQGVAFDLGVSSHQLDAAERGFSFRFDAPLDMRMDRTQPATAADLIAELPERELTRILTDYGEEKWAVRIAKFIVEARGRSPLRTTGDLVRVIEAAVPKAARDKGIHAATRSFQALRIAVNREMESLEAGLDAAMDRLAPEGRIVVISYHSLEDRIAKNRMRAWENPCTCPPQLPVCACGRVASVRTLTRKPLSPSPGEVERNPRSRSARLRAAEKI